VLQLACYRIQRPIDKCERADFRTGRVPALLKFKCVAHTSACRNCENNSTAFFYLTEGVQPRTPYAPIAANENRVTPAARSVHKYRSRGRAEVGCSKGSRRVFRNGVDAGYAQRGRLVASEQPRGAFDIEYDRVTTSAGRVYADSLDIAQRAEDMGFE
jgi:hypothetical protein